VTLAPAPTTPTTGTPALPPGAVRRTSSVDIVWAEPGNMFVEADDGIALHLRGAVRDVHAERGVADEAHLDVGLDAKRDVVFLTSEPADPRLQSLLGTVAGSGFRGRVEAVVPDLLGTPLGALLDDVPVASLIGGYVTMRVTTLRGEPQSPLPPGQMLERMGDLCSGWRLGGDAMNSVAIGQGVPMQYAPPAPPIDESPGAWHHLEPLPPSGMRRRRRMDLHPDRRIDAMFRDTFMDPDGEVALHEYTLTARLDDDGLLRDLVANPHVLPMRECPLAAPNVTVLDGVAPRDVDRVVKEKLLGIAGCTHLNDLLRSLAGLDHLTQLLS
jgi:hypothetical protein